MKDEKGLTSWSERTSEMTPANLSAIWKDIAPALGNHLWQSTAFAVAAGLLTLLLRRNTREPAIGSGWQRR